MIRTLRFSFMVLVCVASAACNASYPSAPTQATPVGLLISHPPRGRVPIGGTLSYGLYAVDSDGAYQNVTTSATFESSDSGIALQNGRSSFVPIAAGTAAITARYAGMQASVPFVVFDQQTPVFPRLSVTPASPAFVGVSAQTAAGYQRSAIAANENVSSAVRWVSENPEVATITANGIITGKGVGHTLITATYEGLSDFFWLTIQPR